MNVLDPFRSGAAFLRNVSPANIRALGNARLQDIVVREIPRARKRVAELQKLYPSAPKREIAQRLIDEKKSIAGMIGGISGVFGLFSVPADLVAMVWLELILQVDIATAYGANLKSDSARAEMLDLFAENNGLDPLTRSAPRTVGTVAAFALARAGLKTFGKAIPLVAAPISGWLNNRHIQRVGDATIRHFEGFKKARKKTTTRANPPS